MNDNYEFNDTHETDDAQAEQPASAENNAPVTFSASPEAPAMENTGFSVAGDIEAAASDGPSGDSGSDSGPLPHSGPAVNPFTGEPSHVFRVSAEDSEKQERGPEKTDAWSDAGYIPAADASAMPRNFHCGSTQEKKDRKEPKAKSGHKGLKIAGVIAACLACAILGGIAGGGIVSNTFQEQQTAVVESSTRGAIPSAAATENSLPVSSTSAAQTRQQNQTQANSGAVMSGTDIYYNLALKQVVGVTTEITYTNVWGYTTSGAVKGSGFIFSEDGYILTNFHVIEDAVKGGYDIQVLTYDGTEYTAEVVGYAADNDVAVLKIEAENLTPVSVGDSDKMLVGEQVYAVGNPLGELEYSLSSGIVSAMDREMTSNENGRSTTINMFQIDAAINSGNSGGPIYNDRGEVVGIATAKYASSGIEGLGFAIPINDAVSIANDLINDGYVRGKAFIGIQNASTLNASSAQYYGIVPGVYFEGISKGSAAEKAGLQVGDIIVGLDDKEIETTTDLTNALKNYHAGDTATLKVYRSSEYVDLTITFDEATPEATSVQSNNNNNNNNNSGNAQSGGQHGNRPSTEEQPSEDGDTNRPGNGYEDFFDYFYDFFNGFNGNPFSR